MRLVLTEDKSSSSSLSLFISAAFVCHPPYAERPCQHSSKNTHTPMSLFFFSRVPVLIRAFFFHFLSVKMIRRLATQCQKTSRMISFFSFSFSAPSCAPPPPPGYQPIFACFFGPHSPFSLPLPGTEPSPSRGNARFLGPPGERGGGGREGGGPVRGRGSRGEGKGGGGGEGHGGIVSSSSSSSSPTSQRSTAGPTVDLTWWFT